MNRSETTWVSSSDYLCTTEQRCVDSIVLQEGANRGKDEPRNLTTVLQMGTVVTVLGLISTCLYYIVTELLPTKMSPNTIFNRAFETIQMDPNIANHFGTPLKAYGRDHGGHREGRRNYIEHETYTSPDDSSNRCRVRFNLQVGNIYIRFLKTCTPAQRGSI